MYLVEAFKQAVNPLHFLNPICSMRRKKAAKFLLAYMENVVQERIKERKTRIKTEEVKVCISSSSSLLSPPLVLLFLLFFFTNFLLGFAGSTAGCTGP